MLLAVASLASAGIVTLVPPYTGATITNSPVTWNVGGGKTTWIVAPFAHLNTGAAGYNVIATARSPFPASHGTDNTEAGFGITYTCAPACSGDNAVTFNWVVTWNWSATLNCSGAVNAQFFVKAAVLNGTGGAVWGSNSVTELLWSTTTPGTYSGGGVAQHVSVVINLLGTFTLSNAYVLESYLQTEVYAHCDSGTDASSNVNIASGGAGGTLSSVVIA